MKTILVINPGSTSTKIALFRDKEIVISDNIEHDINFLNKYDKLIDQIDFRKNEILKVLEKSEIKLKDLDAIACRGGILPPLQSGTYIVNEEMTNYLKYDSPVDHASNLAAVIGYDLSNKDIPVFITDPVSVDEFIDEARISGIPQLERKSLFHALNMKMVAHQAANELDKDYNECNFIIVHMGGGISVGAQENGKMIDVNNANDEGPFSPERSGELPMGDLAKTIFSGKYDEKLLKKRYIGNGGFVGYLKTNDLRTAFKKSESDEKAKLIIEAMAYQISKEIGAMATVLKGNIDAILITGGLANSENFVEMIKNRISKLGLIMVYPGSFEMEALAEGALKVINDVIEPKNWKKED